MFRTKLEELEVETQRFKLHVCSAMSGEPLAQVRRLSQVHPEKHVRV